MCQLAPFASFAQRSFLGAFHNTKLEGLDEARKDIELWVFIQAVAPLTQKSDRLRHWGGGCSCHETELLCGRKVACEKKGHAPSGGALDKTSAFFGEQVSWLAELRQRLSWLGKLPYWFVDATDPTVANPTLKSLRSVATSGDRSQLHVVGRLTCNGSRISAIPQALIDEQEVFRRMRRSSSGIERWHCSVRLVKVRSDRPRIPWLFVSKFVSEPTIKAFDAMPSGRSCILFEWQRWSFVLQAQCRKQGQ